MKPDLSFLKKFPLFNRKKPPVIDDPLLHAKEKYGQEFRVTRAYGGWEQDAAYSTTGEFAAEENGFVRHCGPTAITNLIEAFRTRGRIPNDPKVDSRAIFRRVAAIGKRRLFYWNTDFLKHYGGTVNLAAPAYIRAGAKAYGAPRVRIRGPFPLIPYFVRRSLLKGKLLYLELIMHPTYGNHHVLCYGARELTSADGSVKLLYLLCADGWGNRPRYIPVKGLFLSRYLEIS